MKEPLLTGRNTRLLTVIFAVFALILSGCSFSPTKNTQQFTCEKDTDCELSCYYGAVNANWYADKKDKEICEDGCASEGDYVKCVDKICATFDHNNEKVLECTQRMVEK